MTIAGDYRQGPGGTLEEEIQGAASSQFDRLAVTGAVSLDGGVQYTERYEADGVALTVNGGALGPRTSPRRRSPRAAIRATS